MPVPQGQITTSEIWQNPQPPKEEKKAEEEEEK